MSGYLDEKELKAVIMHVNDKLSSRRIAKEIRQMDHKFSGKTSFREFALWWNKFKETERCEGAYIGSSYILHFRVLASPTIALPFHLLC